MRVEEVQAAGGTGAPREILSGAGRTSASPGSWPRATAGLFRSIQRKTTMHHVFQPCPSGFTSKYCQSHKGCFSVATYMAEIVINPPPPTPNPSKWPTRSVRRFTVDLSILVFCYFNVLMSCAGALSFLLAFILQPRSNPTQQPTQRPFSSSRRMDSRAVLSNNNSRERLEQQQPTLAAQQ